jgi:S1-C subfamily serine protease
VITAIDGGAVKTSADLRRRTQRLEYGDEFTLSVVRDKKTLSLKGKVEVPQTRPATRTIL